MLDLYLMYHSFSLQNAACLRILFNRFGRSYTMFREFVNDVLIRSRPLHASFQKIDYLYLKLSPCIILVRKAPP